MSDKADVLLRNTIRYLLSSISDVATHARLCTYYQQAPEKLARNEDELVFVLKRGMWLTDSLHHFTCPDADSLISISETLRSPCAESQYYLGEKYRFNDARPVISELANSVEALAHALGVKASQEQLNGDESSTNTCPFCASSCSLEKESGDTYGPGRFFFKCGGCDAVFNLFVEEYRTSASDDSLYKAAFIKAFNTRAATGHPDQLAHITQEQILGGSAEKIDPKNVDGD